MGVKHPITHLARASLSLAERNLGRTGENPPVGCVLYSEGNAKGRAKESPRLIARAVTAVGGRPHAEEQALLSAGKNAQGASLYTTLEPCAHKRSGGSCAEKIVRAGVARVIYAVADPDPRTNGKGIAYLRSAGVEVQQETQPELVTLAKCLILGHSCRVRYERPAVTLKLAVSADGKIAPSEKQQTEGAHTLGDGGRIWLSGATALRRAHLLRAEHDAILVGSGTVLADNPRLSVRLNGWRGRQPLRVVLDGRLRISRTARVMEGTEGKDGQETWLFTHKSETSPEAQALSKIPNLRLIETPLSQSASRAGAGQSRLDLPFILRFLKDAGIARVMVEGGAEVASAFLQADLVDALAWFRSPVSLGADGVAALHAPYTADEPQDSKRWHCYARENLARDDVRGDESSDSLSLYLARKHLTN